MVISMYTYLIGWSLYDMFYYGVRWAKISHPSDLWVKYKTSSKHVKSFYKRYGEPDVIQVRRTFSDKDKAILWETKVLRRMNAATHPKFLNKWNNDIIPYSDGIPPFTIPSIQDKVDTTIRRRYGNRGSGSDIIKAHVYETNMERYGEYHTLHLDHVTAAREEANIALYGVTNPFHSPKWQANHPNAMHDPVTRAKHREIMASLDWADAKIKQKNTCIEKYGATCAMNTPEQIALRSSALTSCPCGCIGKRNGRTTFTKTGFVLHMTKLHNWTKAHANEYYTEDQKNQNK